MDWELVFMIGACVAYATFMIVRYGQTHSKKVLYKGENAKQFVVRSYSTGGMAMRGPFTFYVTDKGIWIGALRKEFHPFSDILEAKDGLRGQFTMLDNKLVLASGVTLHFSFMRNQQKEEFFELLETKGVMTSTL